jgi:hypothetical protein
MAEMTVQQFNAHIGAVVMNLQALETAIRFFFYRKNSETNVFPKPGATRPCTIGSIAGRKRASGFEYSKRWRRDHRSRCN